MNTPAVMRFLGGKARARQDVVAGFQADLEAFHSGGHRRWTIWLKDKSGRVGRCGLFRVHSEDAPLPLQGQNEIGWTLAETFWGKGYASEAATAVLDFAFATLGLSELYAQTSDSNVPSTRLMQRLGFARQLALDYEDRAYPARDNPTTVWLLKAEDWYDRG